MIKVDYENRSGVVRLKFTSNKGDDENDVLDAIGNAILTSSDKRGGFEGGSMVIDVLKTSGGR